MIGKRVFKELHNNFSSAVTSEAQKSEESFLAFCSPKGSSLNYFLLQLNTASAIHCSPPGQAFRVDLTESEIEHYTKELIEEAKARDDSIASIPVDDVSVENVLFPTIQYEQEENPCGTTITFAKNVHVEQGVRNKAMVAEMAISKFMVERRMRADLYERFKRLN